MNSEIKNNREGSLTTRKQGGFLELIVLIIVALIILNYFHLTISGILSYFGTSISGIVTWFKTAFLNVFK